MDDERNNREALQAVLARFIQEVSLPDSVAFNFMSWYAGVTQSLAQRAKTADIAPIVGFSGCQGSGKSTLVALMATVMREAYGEIREEHLSNAGVEDRRTAAYVVAIKKVADALQLRGIYA